MKVLRVLVNTVDRCIKGLVQWKKQNESFVMTSICTSCGTTSSCFCFTDKKKKFGQK